MTDYNVIVVGGGHNGLVCARQLAAAGQSVLLLEAGAAAGGASATREFAPGYRVSHCAHWLYQLSPDVARDMALSANGLELAARDLNTVALDAGGNHLYLSSQGVSGNGVSADDQAAYAEFTRLTERFARLLARLVAERPPGLVDGSFSDRMNVLKLGLSLKFMGSEDMSEFLRLILINMYDVMEERFDNPLLKAALSLDGLLGTHMGPRSPNSVFTYLYRRLGEQFGYHGPAVVRGGMGALGAAMARSAESSGVEVRLNAPVASIDLVSSRVGAVTLGDGSQITADAVVSAVDPVTTFRDLLGFRNVETAVARRVSQIRIQGSAAKLHLALDGLPEFAGLAADAHGARLVVAPDMDYIERAFNSAKYGDCSAAPALDISIPTVHDDSLAPAGHHVLSAIVQFAPHTLRAGWDNVHAAFKAQLIEQLDAFAPGLAQRVVASELMTPADLERQYGMTGGHWHHGELSLDQVLMMRPFPGASQYRAPVEGLYLCGAGTHPGGGVMGLAGRNAAREIINREQQS